MKGLDGIQGPVYVGTGCFFNRQALYGYCPPGMSSLPNSSPLSLLQSFVSSRFRPKKPTKDLSEIQRDAKREDLSAAIFNLRDIESKIKMKLELFLLISFSLSNVNFILFRRL